MKAAPARLLAPTVVVAVLAALVAIGACSNQGEGERCEVLNGNDDCKTDEGLICYRAQDLSNTDSDRCCPSDRARARAPVCLTPVDIVGTDAAPPADTGPPAPADASVSETSDGSETPDGG